jgi:hypothetical protein
MHWMPDECELPAHSPFFCKHSVNMILGILCPVANVECAWNVSCTSKMAKKPEIHEVIGCATLDADFVGS